MKLSRYILSVLFLTLSLLEVSFATQCTGYVNNKLTSYRPPGGTNLTCISNGWQCPNGAIGYSFNLPVGACIPGDVSLSSSYSQGTFSPYAPGLRGGSNGQVCCDATTLKLVNY